MARHSARSLRFRLIQELRNAARFLAPPRPPIYETAALPFPNGAEIAARLQGTSFSSTAIPLAESILAHRIPLLGMTLDLGPNIEWRRDALHGKTTGLEYFRRIPYLDFERCGDHKLIWELNRHQHLVLLSQAFLLTDRKEFLNEIWRQLESWMEQNPYPRGINWASALEVAFRALSWLWIDHLAGGLMELSFRRRFLQCLYVHGLHLDANLSVYFSPNTHLLGEAVALHALGVAFEQAPEAAGWRRKGAGILEEESRRQIHDDGSYFELSTYYHVYALDMSLFHALFRQPSPEQRNRLERMGEFLHAMLGPSGELPFLGDDDGGRFFHPFGRHGAYGRATLAACAVYLKRAGWRYAADDLREQAAWWLGATEGSGGGSWESKLFPDAGLAVMASGNTQMVADAGPFGPFSSGHSHADTLSFTLRAGGRDILVDAGTYTYVTSGELRDLFRGTAMHNTVRIDGLNQAEPAGPFGWSAPPEAAIRSWITTAARDEFDAECRYRGFTHRRRIVWEKPGRIAVTDEIDGPGGEHLLEQFWHAGAPVERVNGNTFRIGGKATLVLSGNADVEECGAFGWRSPALGVKIPAPVIRLALTTVLPFRFESSISL